MEHDIELALQIWKQLKPHLAGGDVEAAADDFIGTLLEHGIEANEIISFSLDSELKTIMRGHVEEEDFEDEFDEDEHLWEDYDDSDGC